MIYTVRITKNNESTLIIKNIPYRGKSSFTMIMSDDDTDQLLPLAKAGHITIEKLNEVAIKPQAIEVVRELKDDKQEAKESPPVSVITKKVASRPKPTKDEFGYDPLEIASVKVNSIEMSPVYNAKPVKQSKRKRK